MTSVTVPVDSLVQWWVGQRPPHVNVRCVCGVGGFCGSVDSLARAVGVSHSTMFRRVRAGTMNVLEADGWAVALGVHPSVIWVDWDRLPTCVGRGCD